MKTFTVSVHTTDGQRYQYSADNGEQAREHAAAIVDKGYMAQRLNASVFYGPTSILRVETFPIPQLADQVDGPDERYARRVAEVRRKRGNRKASARSISARNKEAPKPEAPKRDKEMEKLQNRIKNEKLWREMKEIKNK